MSLVYDDIYEITRDTFNLIQWLQDKGVIGNFGGECVRCFEGRITLKNDSSYGRDGSSGVVRRRNVGIKFLLEQVDGLSSHI